MQKNHVLALGVFVFGMGACDGTADLAERTNTAPHDVALAEQCGPARTWRAEHVNADLTDEDLRKFPVECHHVVFGMPPDRCDAAHTWVYENRGGVMSYDELIGFPVECRRYIYGALPKSAQREMWTTQFDRYKATHPSLTDEQRAVLDRAISFISSEISSEHYGHATASSQREIEITEQTIRAFGRYDAGMLIAQLGPAEPEAPKP